MRRMLLQHDFGNMRRVRAEGHAEADAIRVRSCGVEPVVESTRIAIEDSSLALGSVMFHTSHRSSYHVRVIMLVRLSFLAVIHSQTNKTNDDEAQRYVTQI